MYIGRARLCVCLSVCLSVAASPHDCTDPDATWGMVRVPPCALLGGFAIGARTGFIAMTTQHEREISASDCTRSMPGFLLVFHRDCIHILYRLSVSNISSLVYDSKKRSRDSNTPA